MNKSLFRAKRKDNGEFIYWNIYGELCRESGKRTRLAIAKGAGASYYHYVHQINHLLIPESIGRFTALTDMNGKKIFEGDIVSYFTNTRRADNKYIHEVVLETRGGSSYFGIRISKIETWDFGIGVPAKLMEVIGNIHDNPELLGGDENV